MKLKNFNLTFGSQLFKTFSDESRVRILFLLYKNKEMCISDLEQILDFTQAKTSRHVLYLKNSGLLSFKKMDQWVYYYLKDEFTEIVGQLFQYMSKDTTLQNDYETFQVLYSNRELAINKLHQDRQRMKEFRLRGKE
ncbi:metalloregulator ArsR/SmtB family transcription factor [Cytophagaceae bacterium DM2B3-1]|uniref:Metalloregulator ArsR/SmtB family transcription factor n=2 Tax=Xanthocytophaga TaxID=3078918 RepID=A0AAE3QT07_9BACT|nr:MULTISPECIES: metalloregulator ArsR/SmtB family transcription factor [Xanthocytophaga]MDJ1472098.1 metalloregulator ArsR/SmtB family transcription factor [Xanthocytophaga flavus]MDJ1484401.1 metalloregulator ArsR/SmtB family transcription factor [Xanthocytophaga flavus]MDJ1495094.1 metalloregulator ArsR/SmtB family transcription factor [Xanthocytophaga flavus]MDJ1503334.1 metalloregulator ArsR/SmtB family transcription factor [Xanthocytophaga agilis]